MLLHLDLLIYLIINLFLFKPVASGFSDPFLFLAADDTPSDRRSHESETFHMLDYSVLSVGVGLSRRL